MALLICPDCGLVINDTPRQRVRCLDCAKKQANYIRTVRNKEHYAIERGRAKPLPLLPRVCSDCGMTFMPNSMNPRLKRCWNCRRDSEAKFFAIRDIRKKFRELAEADPVEAKGIVEAMRMEEGDGFTELALDGMPEKLRDGLLVASRAGPYKYKPRREKSDLAVKALEDYQRKVAWGSVEEVAQRGFRDAHWRRANGKSFRRDHRAATAQQIFNGMQWLTSQICMLDIDKIPRCCPVHRRRLWLVQHEGNIWAACVKSNEEGDPLCDLVEFVCALEPGTSEEEGREVLQALSDRTGLKW